MRKICTRNDDTELSAVSIQKLCVIDAVHLIAGYRHHTTVLVSEMDANAGRPAHRKQFSDWILNMTSAGFPALVADAYRS